MAMTMEERGSGWRVFAGIMILLVGIFNFIDGIVAIANPHYIYYYVSPSGSSSVETHHLVFGNLTGWGWAMLILGVIQFLVALAIFAGQGWAAVVGIIVATLNAIGQLMLIGSYPWWSIIIIVIDVLVIYGLAVYGFPREA
ncbi:MAG TPA: hypothetical protein VK277_01565 [Acidimicrobiales bacterium]|nr:hypothetical protein [Acidimicrobiales bacterium]